MNTTYILITQYIKNLEDQVLCDNYPIGKELVRHKDIVHGLIDRLFVAAEQKNRTVDFAFTRSYDERAQAFRAD